MKATCPNNPEHKRFYTSAHEVHDWIVDETGEFLEDNGCTDVSHKPDPGNAWVCVVCNAEAKVE